MQRGITIFLVVIHSLTFSPLYSHELKSRFYLSGDGAVTLQNAKTGAGGKIVYQKEGTYPPAVVNEINKIFGIPGRSSENISLRLIAILDYLQDRLKGGNIQILSGYRSPTYNEGLRKKGKLAASTSLHIEGMAADIEMERVDGKRLWEFVRSLNCCGAGYYHGKGIHIDTGPTRFWDEKTTKVKENLGGHNKLILLRTDQDIYFPGEKVALSLGRITDYPIFIDPQAFLKKEGKILQKISVSSERKKCVPLKTRKEAQALEWKIPEPFLSGDTFTVEVKFCQKPFPEMKDSTLSNFFSIVNR